MTDPDTAKLRAYYDVPAHWRIPRYVDIVELCDALDRVRDELRVARIELEALAVAEDRLRKSPVWGAECPSRGCHHVWPHRRVNP